MRKDVEEEWKAARPRQAAGWEAPAGIVSALMSTLERILQLPSVLLAFLFCKIKVETLEHPCVCVLGVSLGLPIVIGYGLLHDFAFAHFFDDNYT